MTNRVTFWLYAALAGYAGYILIDDGYIAGWIAVGFAVLLTLAGLGDRREWFKRGRR